MGCIKRGFHFLGIDYLPTRTEDKTHMTHMTDDSITTPNNAHYLSEKKRGVRRYLSIKSVSQYALFPIREHCAKHANKLSIW
jgi:hypothetical protein